MAEVPDQRRVKAGLDELREFFGHEPIRISPDGWYWGVTFLVQKDTDAMVEVRLAPDDVDVRIDGFSRASSEMSVSITDATSFEIVTGPDGVQRLVVGGSTSGIRQLTLWLDPVRVEVLLDL